MQQPRFELLVFLLDLLLFASAGYPQHGYNYDTSQRPVKNVSQVVQVYTSIAVDGIRDLDIRSGRLMSLIHLTLMWKDELVNSSRQDFLDGKWLTFPADSVWMPGLHIKTQTEDLYKFFHEGRILKSIHTRDLNDHNWGWFYPYTAMFFSSAMDISTDCNDNIDVSLYPFDIQHCEIVILSEQENTEETLLVPLQIRLSNSARQGSRQWEITDLTCSQIEVSNSIADNYSAIALNLTLRRMPLFYMMNILVPSGLLSVLVPMQFILPLDGGERVSMGMGILVASNVFQLLVAQSVPKSSKDIPILTSYLLYLMIVNTVCLIISATLVHFFTYLPHRKPPDCLMSLLCLVDEKSDRQKILNDIDLDSGANTNQNESNSEVRSLSSANLSDSAREQFKGQNNAGHNSPGQLRGHIPNTGSEFSGPVLPVETDSGTKWRSVIHRVDWILFVVAIVAVVAYPLLIVSRIDLSHSADIEHSDNITCT